LGATDRLLTPLPVVAGFFHHRGGLRASFFPFRLRRIPILGEESIGPFTAVETSFAFKFNRDRTPPHVTGLIFTSFVLLKKRVGACSPSRHHSGTEVRVVLAPGGILNPPSLSFLYWEGIDRPESFLSQSHSC